MWRQGRQVGLSPGADGGCDHGDLGNGMGDLRCGMGEGGFGVVEPQSVVVLPEWGIGRKKVRQVMV